LRKRLRLCKLVTMASKKPPFRIEREEPLYPLTVRISKDDKRLLEALTKKLGGRSASDVIRNAIRWLAKESGVE
jgi:hypothetical protein